MHLDKRYIRNIQALSEEESASLFDKTVAVAGCGGLGGYVIENLARMGVGTIIAIDSDVFEESNLNRQLFSTENNLGQPKALAAQERISQVNSNVKIIPKIAELGEENAAELINGADCVVDCLDNMMARFWLAHICQT
ncbi:MAG: ThiF family adenylyltransferase [Coriobacteriales bacterium]|nr:ThiF family adenylyltransferase [Coriobacteriales bacterium]